MTHRWLWCVVFATVLVLAAVPVSAQNEQSFAIGQGSDCIQITPLGDGTQSVEDFYDYRSPGTTPPGAYTSVGTRSIQRSQTSQLFIYRGTKGLSLVFLHDKFGDGGGGLAATADITGLPADGEWVVEDDSYTNRDDVFRHANTSSHIEWVTNGNRTDGAAFRGLRSPNYRTITVDIAFNSDSNRYPFEKWRGPSEQNLIERWIVRSGTGETTALDMNESVDISLGTCSSGRRAFIPQQSQSSPSETESTSAGSMRSTPAKTLPETSTPATPNPTDDTPTANGSDDMSHRDDTKTSSPISGVITVLAAAAAIVAILTLIRQGR